MKKGIMADVSFYMVCQKVKYNREKQPGLLQPLPILDGPWQSIFMDFCLWLPRSSQGNMGIWTIDDRFSKQTHFILVKKTIKIHHMEPFLFPILSSTMVCLKA